MKYFKFLLVFFFTSFNCIGQKITLNELKKVSNEINKKIIGTSLDRTSGIKVRSVISIDRNLIFQYDVPEKWYPPEDLKKTIIRNLIDNGEEKIYINGEFNVGYFYYKKNELIKSLIIDWEEFDKLRFNLGEYVELTNHPKSNGLEVKLKRPLGWEIEEGEGPHIVKKLFDKEKVYLIYIKEIGQFVSKEEINDLLKNDSNEFIKNLIGNKSNDFKLIKHKTVTIENHPFLYFSGILREERMGHEFKLIVHYWCSFLEDNLIYFMGSSISSEDYIDFFKITNSIKLLNQY